MGVLSLKMGAPSLCPRYRFGAFGECVVLVSDVAAPGGDDTGPWYLQTFLGIQTGDVSMQ